MKNKIILFQPYLRQPILNFGKYLRFFEFIADETLASKKFPYAHLPSFTKEINRIKTSPLVRLRRFLGLLNVRIRFEKGNSLFFTYGCMLFTNRPYCIYIENGLAVYNYDLKIANNPIAQIIFSCLVRLPQCKKLIFMSEAAKKSFFGSIQYSKRLRSIIEKKSEVIYPIIERKTDNSKTFSGKLQLLFVGHYYMKGGAELVQAFLQLHAKHKNVFLTIVTPIQSIDLKDQEMLRSIEGLCLLDARFSFSEMQKLYEDYDIFVFPTYRDSFGLVLIEALAWGMPIIGTDQYATSEMIIDNYNGFLERHHPLKDYDEQTFRLKGKYYDPKDFYTDLFYFQKNNSLKFIEDFLVTSVERYLENPTLLEQHSKNSLKLHEERFDAKKLSHQIERVFLEAIKK